MAKTPKKRDKKYNPHAAKRNMIAHAVSGAFNRMYMWGSSVAPMQVFGTARMTAFMPPKDAHTAQKALFDLLYVPATWHIWVMYVLDIGHGQVDVGSTDITMDDAVLGDFTEHLDYTIRNVCGNPENLVAYAYLAAPNNDIDMDATNDPMIEYWLSQGLAEQTALPPEGIKITPLDFSKALMRDVLAIPVKPRPELGNYAPQLVQ